MMLYNIGKYGQKLYKYSPLDKTFGPNIYLKIKLMQKRRRNCLIVKNVYFTLYLCVRLARSLQLYPSNILIAKLIVIKL